MPNAKSDVKPQTLDVEHEFPGSQRNEPEKTGQQNARAALPAEASSEEPQNLRTHRLAKPHMTGIGALNAVHDGASYSGPM
jgi:hypothetical protein